MKKRIRKKKGIIFMSFLMFAGGIYMDAAASETEQITAEEFVCIEASAGEVFFGAEEAAGEEFIEAEEAAGEAIFEAEEAAGEVFLEPEESAGEDLPDAEISQEQDLLIPAETSDFEESWEAGDLQTESTDTVGLSVSGGSDTLEIVAIEEIEITAEEAAYNTGSAMTVSENEVTLYVLGSSYESYLSVPAELPQQYQIPVSADSAVFSVVSGDSVEVSDAGLVTPAYDIWYWSEGGYWSTWSDGSGTQQTRIDYRPGEAVIEVTTAAGISQIKVTVEDYSTTYAEQQIQNYIAANITDSMSTYEKVEAACQYAASFDYSVYASSAYSMIITGGGDCWASSDLICKVCKKVGIPAYIRYAVNDPGAGSGHRNCIVEIDGVLYIAEAGFDMKAPRDYFLSPCSEFQYRILGDQTLEIMQYEGVQTDVTVPETIDGYTVSRIGEYAFANASVEVTSVKLPDTVKSIGKAAFAYCNELESAGLGNGLETIEDMAFYSCPKLEKLSIPASVKSIGNSVFAESGKLANIQVDAENTVYSSKNGVLFNKAGTQLLACPGGKSGVYSVPEGTTAIASYAFNRCRFLDEVILPEGLVSIGDRAFDSCARITHMKLPKSLTSIGAAAWSGCSALRTLIIPKGVSDIGDAIIDPYMTLTAICAEKGSPAEGMAQQNGYRFLETDASGRIYIQKDWFSLDQNTFVYTGSAHAPSVSVGREYMYVLSEGTDYLVSYQDNTMPGNAAKAVLTGTGKYTGTAELAFEITKAEQKISGERYFYAYKNDSPFALGQEAVGKLSYSSDDTSVAAVDADGVVTPKGIGTAYITVTAAETETHKPAVRTIEVEVIKNGWIYDEETPEDDNDADYDDSESDDDGSEAEVQEITGKDSYKKTYGAKAFKLSVKAAGTLSFESDNKKVATVSNTGNVTIKGTGKAVITVKAAATARYKAAKKEITITVSPKKATLSSVKSPKKKQIQVKWKRDKKASGYQVVYALNSKFTKGKKTVTVKGSKTVSVKIKKLKSKKKYYVKVRAYKSVNGEKIYGTYSKAKSVKVK